MERKRIATLTVHNGYNYGASLQAFATVEFLRKQGYDAYLADYRNETIEKKIKASNKNGIKASVKKLINAKGRKLRRLRFDSFNRLVIDSDTNAFSADRLPELNKNYDCFICGSDQIWNPDITGYDSSFFLGFAEEDKNTVAYAPSIGHFGNYSEEVIRFLRENLSSVKHVSVREQENKEIVEELTGKSCPVVLDPVFLLGNDVWNEISEKSEFKYSRKYAIYYSLFEDNEFFEFAKADAKAKGLNLFRMDISPLAAIKKGCRTFSSKGIGPLEFVSLFKRCEFVYTNSFHGSAFALIFNKPFVTALLKGKQSGKNSRILTLLGTASLEERIYKSGEKYDCNINWAEVNSKFEICVNNSRKYLLEAINE